MHGPDAEVVGAVRVRGVDLRRAVRRAADQRVRPRELAGARDRHVVLPDVGAVGAGSRDEVGPVVEDEEGAGGGAQLTGDGGRREQVGVGRVLLAQLEDVHAAGEGGREDVGERAAAGPGAGDEVEAGAVEAVAAVGEGRHAGIVATRRSVRVGRVLLKDSAPTFRNSRRRARCAGSEAGHCSW